MEGDFVSVIAAFLIILKAAVIGWLLGMGTSSDYSERGGRLNER
jgi:hypothetical protein